MTDKPLLKSVIIYSGTGVINAAIPFLLLPLLTNKLTQEEYGILTLYQVLVSIVVPFLGLNTVTSLGRIYFDKGVENHAKFSGSILSFLTISLFIFLPIGYLFREPIEALIEFPSAYLLYVFVFAYIKQIIDMVLSLFRVRFLASRFGILRIVSTIFDVGLSILFVVGYDQGWVGRVEGQLFGVAIAAVVSLILMFRWRFIAFSFNAEYIKIALKFALPLIPHLIGGMLIIYTDRLFISKMVGLGATGLYGVGFQIAMIVNLFLTSFNQAWAPWFYKRLNENNEKVKKQIVKYTYYYVVGCVLLVFMLIVSTELLMDWFIDEKFKSANQFVFWLAIGFGINGMYKMMVNYLLYLKRTAIISAITMFTALTNIALNYLFIKQFDAIGATYATACAFTIQFILIALVALKSFKMPWFK